MAEIRDYSKDIEINEFDLESEWITHSSLYMHYSGILAEAIANKDDAKLKMEWIAAKIDLDVRKNWSNEKYDLEKLTEGAIKNITMTNGNYLKAYRKYNHCVKIVNSLTGVKTAFEHRKHALSNLVSLQISGFNSEPRNKIQDLQNARNKNNHNNHKEDLTESMNKRKKK